MIKIYIINLKKDKDRRQNIINQFNKQNIQFSFIDAIDGNYVKKTNIQNFSTNAQIGIFLSHRYIWNDISNNEDEYAVICEDDIIIPDNFIHKINLSIKNNINWDIITFNKQLNIYPLHKFISACCYLVRKDFTKKLLTLDINGHVDVKINYSGGDIIYRNIGIKLGNFTSNNTNQIYDNELIWIMQMPWIRIPFFNININVINFTIINFLLYLYTRNISYNFYFSSFCLILFKIVNC